MKKFKIALVLIVLICIGVFSTYHWISYKTSNLVYDDVNTIPKNKVGLVLGTGKYTANGTINLFYKFRIDAAVKLFNAGKIEYILVSGDNGRKDYDEPTDFKNDLISKGIPAHKIFLDYAGFRTLDSVVRAKEIFGQTEVTVISQKFHNQRAIYIANHFNIKAVGFNAKDPLSGRKARAREYLARSKASFDLVFNVQPKFLGNPIKIQ
ncbi:YdcF family protein [Winogradskyella echinorum]|uniref:YdcF family protein n=1 Tax=Winogradskyella echinorum TaxID=538189 RepID=A0ABR6XWT2_9FLAO|nr:ElyC/SanA/YdcF family protein [Winogradskyella echinorum]MBC3844844.1 YdcF family protein [Winogradskyella echinorum]MBC5749192.1 YdcF family protein [Winogradskyella echinorum]